MMRIEILGTKTVIKHLNKVRAKLPKVANQLCYETAVDAKEGYKKWIEIKRNKAWNNVGTLSNKFYVKKFKNGAYVGNFRGNYIVNLVEKGYHSPYQIDSDKIIPLARFWKPQKQLGMPAAMLPPYMHSPHKPLKFTAPSHRTAIGNLRKKIQTRLNWKELRK